MAPGSWLSLAILTAGLLSAGPVGVRAQTSSAVCLSSFNWVSPSILGALSHSQCIRWLDGQQRQPGPLCCFSVSAGRMRGWSYGSFLLCPPLLHRSHFQSEFSVDPLPNGTHYTGPYADEQNECQCSTVTYCVISACGLCQNRTIIR